ncbi:hypothetical protein LT493_31005 [Streptomyces tricolor]|nr:hypothetical protein [Streptomyces tricolor]
MAVGQRVTAEVQGAHGGGGRVVLSAKACEDEALYRHLRGARPGDVVTGTVAAVHPFGVFVRLDGAPPHPRPPRHGFRPGPGPDLGARRPPRPTWCGPGSGSPAR